MSFSGRRLDTLAFSGRRYGDLGDILAVTANHGGLSFIFRRAIDFCWFCFKWGLVLGVIGVAVAVPFLYRRVDEELRRRVEARIAQHYVGLKVTIRSAELVEGEGIKVRDLLILEPGAEGPHPELLHVEEVLLGCRENLKELIQESIQGEPQFTEIRLSRPTLRATRRPDGTFSTAKLLPLPTFQQQPIPVRIENGVIEIFDPLKNPSSTLALRDVNCVLTPLEAGPQPSSSPHLRQLQGALSGDYLRRAEFQGVVDLKQQACTISGAVEGLDISPELRDSLPEPLAARLAGLEGLRGQGELTFRIGYQPSAASPLSYQLTGSLSRGRIDDPRLPHPLTDLRARTFRLDNDGLVIEAEGRSNQATVQVKYRQAGFAPESARHLEAEIRRLELDRRLLDVLPEPLQEQWHRYRPAGLVDVDVKLSYDGHTWQPDLAVRCLNVSFTYYRFPYRLDDAEGMLTLKDDVLTLHLIGYSATQPIRLDGEWRHPMTAPAGYLEAKGDHVPLDNKLLAALPEETRAVVQALSPRGTLNCYVRLWRDDPQQPLHKHLSIVADRCSVQWERFPYPLRNVCGKLEMFDDSWTFHKLEGLNDDGHVTCTGHLTPTLQGRELYLHLRGDGVPLNEVLRDALRPNERQVWDVLRPRGAVDLEAEVRYLSEQKQLSVGIVAWPQPETSSIEPIHFPYRMDKLGGVLRYLNGHVTLEHFTAEHGPVKIAAAGFCDFPPDGKWHLHLEPLSVDRLRLDRDLTQALPGRLKKALLELKPGGPMNLAGSFDLEPGPGVGDPVQSRWDVQLGLHQGSLDCGVKLQNIHGRMRLVGQFDGQRFQSLGELAVESLNYKDYQFTQVLGPMWIDDQRILLGSWVARRPGEASPNTLPRPPEQPRPITANFFGGTLYGDAWVVLGAEPRYGLRADLLQADLARCAQEVTAGSQNLRGTVTATVDLHGSGHSSNALGGQGAVQLRNADVYELPLMIALLKILSIRPPDQKAFSTSDIDFRIQGEHIYFDRIDFKGDAISLLGKGEMDFQQAVKLTFHAIVGRGEMQIPVLKELFTGVSRQIMLIHVDGTLQNPVTVKDPFPGVNHALQQLQGDRPAESASPGLFPHARQPKSDADGTNPLR